MLHATALARGEIVTQMGTCPTKFTCPLTTLAKLASYLHICYGLNNSSLIVGLANVYFFSSIFDTAQVLTNSSHISSHYCSWSVPLHCVTQSPSVITS